MPSATSTLDLVLDRAEAARLLDEREAQTARRELFDLRAAKPPHPLVVAILALMREDPAKSWSPRALTDALEEQGVKGATLGNVSYHVRTLASRRVLAGAGTKPRRGAVEHFYRLRTGR